ncbi:proline-rich protein HaeIII subfamily 1-like [Poecile atricapillus]|uniref:proline-rich protein HaeIII subfamily 1-like n=1 Tax=Poecile atricapillus TaxID=48891 RepID=UPI0027381BCB|nr:proline-rich protein HaeIII subfamily 1-like [Poecile atricapillus]
MTFMLTANLPVLAHSRLQKFLQYSRIIKRVAARSAGISRSLVQAPLQVGLRRWRSAPGPGLGESPRDPSAPAGPPTPRSPRASRPAGPSRPGQGHRERPRRARGTPGWGQRCFVPPHRCPHADTGAGGGSAGNPGGSTPNPAPGASRRAPFPPAPGHTSIPRRRGLSPAPGPPSPAATAAAAPQTHRRPCPRPGVARHGFVFERPRQLRGPPGPGRACGPFNGGGPARPAARARPAPRPRPLAARPAAALCYWLSAPRPRAPIGWRCGAASPAASCFKVTLSGGRRGQESPAPLPRPDWQPRLLFKRLKRLARAAADWPARLSITTVPATPSRRGAGPHVREARRERARSDPRVPEILGSLEITQSIPLPRQGHPEQHSSDNKTRLGSCGILTIGIM